MSEEMVSISFANLITTVCCGDGDESAFVIRHPTDPSKPWQSLSAGPKFYEEEKNHLTTVFHADPFGFSGDDARCVITLDKLGELEAYLKSVIISDNNTQTMRVLLSELHERLTGEYWLESNPLMNDDEFGAIQVTLVNGLFIKQSPSYNEKDRDGKGAKVRFFVLWKINIPNEKVYNRFVNSTLVKIVDEKALDSTEGGRKIGSFKDVKLANNVGVKNDDW